ncbi:MAG: Uncharacterized protein RBG13Loki_3250 [Promethearchaeota archaeon CR_4]|nr:MAG: Uncharacterized protein RBG13Loki_3250 [Candidatus Lokiarchaeota archaeon CR_4]
MSVNVYTLRMVEDFMQNLAGVFFLLYSMYFSTKWFENMREWKKNGLLTALFLVCSIATHVYTGGLAAVLFGALFLFNFVGKWAKTRKLPTFELKILGLLALAATGVIVGLIFLFPTIYTNFIERIQSWWITFSFLFTKPLQPGTDFSLNVFLTIPYLLGLIVVASILIRGLKTKTQGDTEPVIAQKTFLAWLYLVLGALLFFLVGMPSQWQARFILLAYVPISLVSAVFLKWVEYRLVLKRPSKKALKLGIVGGISTIFGIVTLVNAILFLPTMGPTLIPPQYNELVYIRNQFKPAILNSSCVIHTGSFEFGYWITYVFDDIEVDTGDPWTMNMAYPGQKIFVILKWRSVGSPFRAIFTYPWNPITPLRFDTSELISPHQGSLPPPQGKVIFHGMYLDLRLLYYENGTLATP